MGKIFSNFGLKIAALFLAMLLWFHATTDKTFVHDFELPLVLSGIPSDLILASEIPSKVKVKVRGKGKQLIKYFLSDKEGVTLDLSKFRANEISYVIRPEAISLPKDLSLEVAEVDSPKWVKIQLDYLVQKEVPIKSQIELILQSGYVQLDSLKLKPDKVTLSGPRTSIKKIDWIDTERKVLGSLSAPASGSIPLIMPEGFNLKLSPSKVEYEVGVEKLLTKEFPQVKINLLNVPARRKAKIEPESVSVVVQGISQQIEKLDLKEIKVSLNLGKLVKGRKGKSAVQVELPQGVELVKVQPDSIKFVIQ